jgi:Leucine-rich repeat (LRR) protein
VEHLDLRENSLKRLAVADISRLQNLDTLILNHNQIRHLDPGLLDALPKLQRLILVRNQLRTLPSLASKPHAHLKVLDLHSNHLHRIEGHIREFTTFEPTESGRELFAGFFLF